jgi:SAM-dependent methyltransferase
MERPSQFREHYKESKYLSCAEVLTGRDFTEYLDALKISSDKLVSPVLDLGSGKDEIFARGAADLGIKVISVSPHLLNKKLREERISDSCNHKSDNENPPAFSALAGELPLKNDSIKTIVSVYSIPTKLPPDYDVFRRVFSEIARVLAPNGHGYFFPFRVTREPGYKSALEVYSGALPWRIDSLDKIFADLGLEYQLNPISDRETYTTNLIITKK